MTKLQSRRLKQEDFLFEPLSPLSLFDLHPTCFVLPLSHLLHRLRPVIVDLPPKGGRVGVAAKEGPKKYIIQSCPQQQH